MCRSASGPAMALTGMRGGRSMWWTCSAVRVDNYTDSACSLDDSPICQVWFRAEVVGMSLPRVCVVPIRAWLCLGCRGCWLGLTLCLLAPLQLELSTELSAGAVQALVDIFRQSATYKCNIV
jgi:hypothetical protein